MMINGNTTWAEIQNMDYEQKVYFAERLQEQIKKDRQIAEEIAFNRMLAAINDYYKINKHIYCCGEEDSVYIYDMIDPEHWHQRDC